MCTYIKWFTASIMTSRPLSFSVVCWYNRYFSVPFSDYEIGFCSDSIQLFVLFYYFKLTMKSTVHVGFLVFLKHIRHKDLQNVKRYGVVIIINNAHSHLTSTFWESWNVSLRGWSGGTLRQLVTVSTPSLESLISQSRVTFL